MSKWENLRAWVDSQYMSEDHGNAKRALYEVSAKMIQLDSEIDGDEMEDRLKSPNSPVNKLRTSVSWLEADVGELMGARDALWTELRKLERIVTDAQHQAIEQIQVRLDGMELRLGEHQHLCRCFTAGCYTSKPVKDL